MRPEALLVDLEGDYGLTAATVQAHAGGFESDCWVIDGTWFVKVWKDGGHPQRLDLLDQLHDAGLPVVPPVRTTAGNLASTSGGRSYAVFPYINGRTATLEDWSQTVDVMKRVHGVVGVDLPPTTIEELWIGELRDLADHPWIGDRRGLLLDYIDRLEAVIDEARVTEARHVICHQDLQGGNLLIRSTEVVAILDWDWARLAPREHDMWITADTADPNQVTEFLDRYGARDLDPTHLEYALVARALRDLYARVSLKVDRPGVETEGFDRLARIERALETMRRYCRST